MIALLLAAVDTGGRAAAYVCSSLHWHVRQAVQPGVAIRADALLMEVLTHESGDVRRQGAIGVGIERLVAAADGRRPTAVGRRPTANG